jgi:hypothetical protein
MIHLLRSYLLFGFNALQNHPEISVFMFPGEFERYCGLVAEMGKEAEGLMFRVMAEVLNVQIVHH